MFFQGLRTHQMELAAHGTSASAVPATSSSSSDAPDDGNPASPVAIRALHEAAHVQGAICERRFSPEPIRASESAADERAPSESHELSLESGVQPASSFASSVLITRLHLVMFCQICQYSQ